MRETLSWAAPLVAGGTFLALLVLESRMPLRRPVEPKLRRLTRNAVLLAVSAACVAALQAAFLTAFVAWAEQRRIGLLWLLPLSDGWRLAAGVLLLDYTLWHWHRLNHLVPFLWRFHVIHHADRDLDASTGARFHFGEMSLSVGYRALQVALIGADALTLALFNAVLIPSVLFHHSNLRLHPRLDRALLPFLVTPRMHSIHHSNWRSETDSNWSSLLTLWDRLHGTLRLDVPLAAITIGVPAYATPAAVTLPRMLAGPLQAQPDHWQGRLRREGPSRAPAARAWEVRA
jgi:sterol desaturase/sphingolipid hydroxylase (fatty acid hydroxylase superfamily)